MNFLKVNIKKNSLPLFTFLITAVLLFGLVGSYTFVDEYDVCYGSWLVSKGLTIYNDFFNHHPPLPFLFFSIFHKIGISSVIGLRVICTSLIFLWLIFIYNLQKSFLSEKLSCLYIILFALALPLHAGFMVFADIIAALCLLTILMYVFKNKDFEFNLKEKIIISLCVFISITNALTSFAPVFCFFIFLFISNTLQFLKHKLNLKTYLKELGTWLLFVWLPFLCLLLYLLIAGNLKNFINQVVLYNLNVYSKFIYMGHSATFFHVLKVYMTGIKEGYLQSWYGIISQAKAFIQFALWFKFDNYIQNIINVIMFFWVLFLLPCIYLFFSGKKMPKILFGILTALSVGMRSPFPYDYATGFYIHTGAFISCVLFLLLVFLKDLLDCKLLKEKKYFKFMISVGLTGLLFFILTPIYLSTYVFKYPQKELDNYVKTVEHFTEKEDYIWSFTNESYEVNTQLIAKRLPPCKFYYYYEWIKAIDENSKEVIQGLDKTHTKLVLFMASPDYLPDLMKYLNDKYYTSSKFPNFYFRKEFKEYFKEKEKTYFEIEKDKL